MSLEGAMTGVQSSDHSLICKKAHDVYKAPKRGEYLKIREFEAFSSPKFTPFIIDGADWSGFGLLQLTTETKEMPAHFLKGRLTGILGHGVLNKFSLFTMTEETET